jgi:hypothetical protein
MPHHHPLTITVNDQLTVDAGYWQECVEEDQTPYRLALTSCRRISSDSTSWSRPPSPPFPIAHLDGSTYYNRFRALGVIKSANGRRYLMEALARDFGSE